VLPNPGVDNAAEQQMSGLRVETMAGIVEGVEQGGVARFLGVPFGGSPMGQRRFLAPSPPTPWAGVRSAKVSRTSPPQLPSPVLIGTGVQAPGDEDCLELDITTPAADDARRPVMVWFYGGGFTIGSAGTYDPSSMVARGDVVVVTVNYRLGVLGFSYLQHLDEMYAGSANAGIRDQIESLRWVRDNIASFGGDPGCVTIFGQSAGGHSVGCLLTCSEGKGLYHRCILESSSGWGLRSIRWAEAVTANLMTKLGWSVDALLTSGVDEILAVQAALPMRLPEADSPGGGPRTMGVAAFPFAPTLDHVVLNGEVIDEVAAGRAPHVPILICHTSDEIRLFDAMGFLPDPSDEQELRAFISIGLADTAEAVEAYRQAEPGGSLKDWFISYLTDQTYHMPDYRFADFRAPHDSRIWMARFSWRSPAEDNTFGACHGMEIPFLFWRPGETGGFLGGYEAPSEVAFVLQDAWATFARTGDPNCGSLPSWPRYTAKDRDVMELNTQSHVLTDPDGPVREIWKGVIF
jgi:para-nitrobenzyl esterase